MMFFRKSMRQLRAKVPTVLQMEAVECGAASLAMILAYYGRFVSLEILREKCGVSRDGSKASNILKAARSYGFVAKGFHYEIDELKTSRLPLIIHWDFGHFMVLEGFGKNKVFLNDPSEGSRTVSYDEFDIHFTGIALTFEPTELFEKGGVKFNLMKSLWTRIKGNLPALYFALIAGVGMLILGLIIPFFSKIYIDDILLKGRNEWLMPLLLGMGVTALLRALFGGLQKHFLLKLEVKLNLVASSEFIWHLFKMPLVFFTQRSSGDLSYRMARNQRISSTISNDLINIVLNLIMVLFFAVIMFFYEPLMTMIVIAVTVLNISLLKYISKKRSAFYLKMVQDICKMSSVSMSGVQTIETLKATGAEDDFFSMWSGHQAKIVNGEQHLGVLTQKLSLVYAGTTAGLNAIILTIGAFKVLDGQMSIGLLVAYQSLLQSFLAPVNQLVDVSSLLQEVSADLNRVEDVIRYPEDRAGAEVKSHSDVIHVERLEGAVELKNITFGYSPLEPPLIVDFNLKMVPGARIALVGSSGSGKSTLSKIVSGLYQPWTGEVLFDGVPRNQLPDETLKTSFAVVDQEISLFRESIKDNISLWDETLPEIEVVGAAKDALIHDEITARLSNYSTLLDEGGANFSGGQRQRIEIARALALNPSILVLDEATSALDSKTEKAIDENIRKRGCTCLIIAHRLSTIRDSDEIIVLENGRIAQRGTHDDMIRVEGPYKNLLSIQS